MGLSNTILQDFEIVTVLKSSPSTEVLLVKKKEGPLTIIKTIDSSQPLEQVYLELQAKEHTHRNLLPLLSSFFEEDKVCLQFPFCYFRSLADFVYKKQPGGIAEDKALLAICKQILAALGYLHQNHVLHREIVPANLLVDRQGLVLLKNFASAGRLLKRGELAKTKKSLKGDPCYFAPEMVLGETGYDGKRDVWALGVTLLELAFGCEPFGNEFSQASVLYKLATDSEALESLSGEKLEERGEALNTVIRLMLKKNPEERPSAAELLAHPVIKKIKNEESVVKEYLEKFEVAS